MTFTQRIAGKFSLPRSIALRFHDRFGPWYQLAGSYAEPIAGDENPETYGVPIASLHADHVAADNMRIVNHRYATDQLLPQARIPGFVFHQTERTSDNGTATCFGNAPLRPCFDSNVRDFDLLGYQYSVLSTVATAGQNVVLTMIPARDAAEFELLPKEDLAFVHDWLAWTDTHLDFLRNAEPIPNLPAPALGSVDGTHAMHGDEGFVFLFNPGYTPINATLHVDEHLGISNASVGASWTVSELFPTQTNVGTWGHGDTVDVAVGRADARVLRLTKRAAHGVAAPLGLCQYSADQQNSNICDLHPPWPSKLSGCHLPKNKSATGNCELFWDPPSDKICFCRVGGLTCSAQSAAPCNADASGRAGHAPQGALCTPPSSPYPCGNPEGICGNCVVQSAPNVCTCTVGFGQEAQEQPRSSRRFCPSVPAKPGGVQRMMPVGDGRPSADNTGGSFSTTFTVPASVVAQLQQRGKDYPIPWSTASPPGNDYNASWLVQTRLLAYAFIADPQDSWTVTMSLDGEPVAVTRAYNSRGRTPPVPRCFLGFYADLSGLKAGTPHTLKVELPKLPVGAFQGVFWENLVTEY